MLSGVPEVVPFTAFVRADVVAEDESWVAGDTSLGELAGFVAADAADSVASGDDPSDFSTFELSPDPFTAPVAAILSDTSKDSVVAIYASSDAA